MAISFVNESHSPGMNGYVSSVTIDVPAGVQQNDLLIAVVGGTRDTAPSGWTLLGSAAQGSSTGTVYVYYRLASSSEPSSYTFTFSGVKYSKNHSIIAYRGVDTSNPIGEFNIKADSSTSYDTNSISVSTGEWVASFATHYTFDNNTVRTWTVNSGTERTDYGGSVGTQENSSMAWYDSNGSVSSGSYSRTHTASSSTSVGTTGILSINPVGSTEHSVSPSDTVTLSDSTETDLDGPIVFTAAYSVSVG